jgi:anion-transporting  ArsA/GET3 family ATPase
MTRLDELRFLFVTGKGGVGKSTACAALALALAARGKRVLVVTSGANERLSSLFGVSPLGTEVVAVGERLWATRITAESAMREYGQMILRSKVAYNAVFGNKYVKSFFNAVPGLNEWAVLGKAWYHSIEGRDEGQPRFDVVLFDAPATGHGLDMLRVPKVIVDIVPPGVLRRDAERAWTMFRDPTQSGVVVVTLPEDMPTNETAELFEALENELELPVALLVINQVIEQLFDNTERARLLLPRDYDRTAPGDEAVACGVRRAIREQIQAENLARLNALGAETVRLPLLLGDADTPEAVRRLAADHF